MTPGEALMERLGETFAAVRGRVAVDAPLAPLTWFRAGGAADILYQPADADDLAATLARLPGDVPVTVIGVGSNLLVRDGGLAGVVIRLSARGFGAIERLDGNRLRVGTAVPDKRVAAEALEAGLSGFEFYHGIPGTIGGALRMNAGANGTETTQRVVAVEAVDRTGRHVTLDHAAMGYSYRHSGASADLIFTAAVMEGEPGSREAIEAAMAAVQHHRETVQPVREKTGGSTFKNPPGESAWKLIDAAGLRGHRRGGAQMSPLHCNFMINTGSATAADLEGLGEEVRARVHETTGTLLEWEIKRLGRSMPGDEVTAYSPAA